MNKTDKLTSVKVSRDDFLKFKENAVRDNFSFKKLVDKALYLYNTDSIFRKMIQDK